MERNPSPKRLRVDVTSVSSPASPSVGGYGNANPPPAAIFFTKHPPHPHTLPPPSREDKAEPLSATIQHLVMPRPSVFKTEGVQPISLDTTLVGGTCK